MLNKLQQAVVDSDSKLKSIAAGAGTGKTTTLTELISADLRRGYDPAHMIAITFTRNASVELLERVESKLGDDAQKIFANTIHGFCLMIIKRYIDRTGYQDNFNIYDSDDRKDIIKSVIRYMKVKKVKYEDVEAYVSTGTMRTLFEPMVYDEYMDRMRRYNAIDLSMIIPMAMVLLQEDEVKADVATFARHFYVDEFQDTNDMQLALLKMLDMETLTVIGDPDQAIYEWNGAKPENMVNLQEIFPGIEQFILEDNYRSTRQIIEKSNRLIRYNKNRIDKKLIAHKDGNEPMLMIDKDETAQCNTIADLLVEPYRDNAIICRTNGHAKYLYDNLKDKGISCNLISSASDPFKTQVGKNLLKLLNLANNMTDDYAARIIGRWLVGLSDKALDKMISAQMGKTLFEVLRDETKVGELLYVRMKSLKDLKLKNRVFAYDYIMEVIDKCDILGYYNVKDRVTKVKQVDEFRKEIRIWQTRQKYFGGDRTFEEFMRYIKLRDIQEGFSKTKDAVNIMTVHGSKGLEFERVFIPYMNEKAFPLLRGTNPNVPEERRIMYVAATRAREELFILRPDTVKARSGATLATTESRFLLEMRW